jgi:peptidoglycan L-alanyl-D-glutamate endopeptidase CwlK
MSKSQVQTVCRDATKLAPFLVVKLNAALAECISLGYVVAVFEGYRSPDRQQWLYDQGRTRDGKIITNARPYESFHLYGLAVDIVGYYNKKWDWSIDYDKITEVFKRHGFKPLKFEKAHFQIDGGLTAKKAKQICKDQGLLALWNIVETNLRLS